MNETQAPSSRGPIPCAGVVCLRDDEVLLIRRAKEPRMGEWSIPGGRIEWGERASDAALRELKEETGVDAELIGLIDVIDSTHGEGESASCVILVDYAARWIGGEPIAGDDAAEARFVPMAELESYGLWDETLRVILLARLLVS